MRIKKIEVVGFKSFAERETFTLDERVTGVIGPNGCGKSNIVDAIRWCLGEQRARQLRGQGMADVIFGGSSARGPAGMAEVTITFENEGDVAGSYLNFSEIGVTRRLYRDGTSEYLINKVPCRLRDITDLLMGTGVGSRGYSIIEQGRVSQIVTSKPETRRHFIDEAAGITKFKTQKATAERRIQQTRQNLLRVNDVIHELEGRLGTLRRQAQKAERYKRYRGELRDLELWVATHRYLELTCLSSVLEARRSELAEAVDGLRNETATRDAKIEAERIALRELDERLAGAQQGLYDLENRIQLIEQDRKFRDQEREGLRRSAEGSTAEAAVVERGLVTLREELAGVVERRSGLDATEDHEGEAEAVDRLAADYQRCSERLESDRAALDEGRRKHADAETRRASLDARLGSRRDEIEDLGSRSDVIQKDLDGATEAVRTHASTLTEAKTSLETAQGRVASIRTRRAELDAERAQTRDALEKADVEVETARKELLRARSRLQSLQEIQSRYRGCASGVQVVMEHREQLAQIERQLSPDGTVSESAGSGGAEVHGIMADFISAPERYEAAVSAMLGDRLQGVVVDGPTTGASGVQLLKGLQEGRTTFLPASNADALRRAAIDKIDDPLTTAKEGQVLGWSAPDAASSGAGIDVVDVSGEASTSPASASSAPERAGVLGRLIDLVDVDAQMRPLAEVLLGDALVVESLARALELWHGDRPDATLVTLDGDRLEPTGVVVGGSADAVDSALLQQKREIRELSEIVTQLEGDFESVTARRQGVAERLTQLESDREASERDMLDAEKVRIGAAQAVEAQGESHARAERDVGQFETQLRELRGRLSSRTEELAAIETELNELRVSQPALLSQIEAWEAACTAGAAERETLSQQLSDARVAFAKWQQERDALQTARDRLERQIRSEDDRCRKLRDAAAEAMARIEAIGTEIENMVREHATLLETHKTKTTEKHDILEAHDAAKIRVDELELSIRELRKDLEEHRERLGDVELGLRERALEREHLEGDVRDRFDDELRCVVSEFHDRPTAGEPERKRAKELKRIISRMGEVNLTAIGEYEEVSERYEYLTGQRSDLEEAIDSLQAAIDRINATTRERFKETFEQVNDMFKTLFPRLFNGGKAELVLTDPSDLLTTGVEILAQPPGKKVQNLELLSGGEKALTAVSLIFSIFLIKPSPFCLLDEVDAPLDEANVGRFCGLVRELSENTQFIIITHNKRSMEEADRLYGVTMQQRGVSKLVTVNMRRAAEEASYS